MWRVCGQQSKLATLGGFKWWGGPGVVGKKGMFRSHNVVVVTSTVTRNILNSKNHLFPVKKVLFAKDHK